LSAPDYNTVIEFVSSQRAPAEKFAGKKIKADAPELLQSITADDGSVRKELSLKVPTLKVIRMRDKQEGSPLKKAIWLTANCTGLGSNDMLKLAMPDWMQLQVRLGDFLSEPAAYFQSGTSSN
jgi:hypothetical protein